MAWADGDLAELWSVWSGFLGAAMMRHPLQVVVGGPSWAQVVMGQWVDILIPEVTAFMGNDWTCDQVFMRDVVPSTTPDEVYTGTLNVQGSGTGGNLPPQCAVVITWYTDLQGRANRGRSYMPGIDQSATLDGILFGSNYDAYNTYAAGVLDLWTPAASAQLAQIGVISRQLNGAPRGPVLIPVTSQLVRNILGVRRRRADSY